MHAVSSERLDLRYGTSTLYLMYKTLDGPKVQHEYLGSKVQYLGSDVHNLGSTVQHEYLGSKVQYLGTWR